MAFWNKNNFWIAAKRQSGKAPVYLSLRQSAGCVARGVLAAGSGPTVSVASKKVFFATQKLNFTSFTLGVLFSKIAWGRTGGFDDWFDASAPRISRSWSPKALRDVNPGWKKASGEAANLWGPSFKSDDAFGVFLWGRFNLASFFGWGSCLGACRRGIAMHHEGVKLRA